MIRPQTSYFVCATPRSGSTLLCEALRNTGIAGRPEEYFGGPKRTRTSEEQNEPSWQNLIPVWSALQGVSTYSDYLSRVIKIGTTSNGVFGAKLMWSYFGDFINQLHQTWSDSVSAEFDLLSLAFPKLRYIWITRHDKIQQAVSYWKAIQTWIWRTDEPLFPTKEHTWIGSVNEEQPMQVREPKFNFEAIKFLLHQIELQEAAWWRYFKMHEIQPFIVVYEDLISNYESTAIKILNYLNVSPSENRVFMERRLKQQADSLSKQWIYQYHKIESAIAKNYSEAE